MKWKINKYVLLLFINLPLACSSSNQNNQVWMENEIRTYLRNSSHPVTTLHVEGKTEQLWFKTDNVQIENISCPGFQLDLVLKHSDQMPGRILASCILAFDTIGDQKFEMDFATGDFKAYK